MKLSDFHRANMDVTPQNINQILTFLYYHSLKVKLPGQPLVIKDFKKMGM